MQDIICYVLQRNTFYGHSGNILVSMIDGNSSGIRRIKNTRNNIILIQVHHLNINDKGNTELLDWQQSKITKPPLFKSI